MEEGAEKDLKGRKQIGIVAQRAQRQDNSQFKTTFSDRIYRIDRINFHPVNPVILSK